MSVSTPPPDLDQLPAPEARPASRLRPSLVWFVPVLAALIGITLAVQSLLARGPEITLRLNSAEGLEAGKTPVKYKEVDIGKITDIQLSEDRRGVIATIALSKQAAPFAVSDTRFWVVKPQIGVGGVSGLSTLLSGAYIGIDSGRSTEKRSDFVALDEPPVVTADVKGTTYVLKASELGSLDIGAPVFYRRIPVGQVTHYALDQSGQGVTLGIVVKSPYDRFVTSDSRFWHASGIDVELGAEGVKVNTQSLASILAGGIAFQDGDAASPSAAARGTVFSLHGDQRTAMRKADGAPVTVVVNFPQSLRGLTPGAPVDFRGVVVGEVKTINVRFDRERRMVLLPVTLQLYPDRLRSSTRQREPHEFMARLISRGLRAQLRNGNLLTGQLYVALDFFPKAAAVAVNPAQRPLEIPAMPGSLDELQSAVTDIVAKVQKMPLDEIGSNLNKTLAATDQLIRRVDSELAPEARVTLQETRAVMSSAALTLAPEGPLQQELQSTLQELSATARALRQLGEQLSEQPESLIQGKREDQP